MKIKALEYFLTIAKEASFNGAAKKLGLSQPSLSKSIQAMEKELGFELFSRSHQGIELTDKGQTIKEGAQQILDIYQSWLELKDDSLDSIDIYTYVAFPDFIIPHTLLGFRKKYPKIPIRYTACATPEDYISRSLKNPTISLVLSINEEELHRLSQLQGSQPLKLMDGKYRCLVNPQSPYAHKEALTLDDLKKMYLVLPSMKDDLFDRPLIPSPIQEFVDTYLEDRYIEVESLGNVLNLVKGHSESYALTYYPASLRFEDVKNGKLKALPVEHVNLTFSLYMFYSDKAYKDQPVFRELVQAIKKSSQEFLDLAIDS
ncbi:MAG: LysR family transcriptional regulator [Tissierellia bacterium]|nr:LysR family transcriptional regulator [Tissierellia bacterium]